MDGGVEWGNDVWADLFSDHQLSSSFEEWVHTSGFLSVVMISRVVFITVWSRAIAFLAADSF